MDAATCRVKYQGLTRVYLTVYAAIFSDCIGGGRRPLAHGSLAACVRWNSSLKPSWHFDRSLLRFAAVPSRLSEQSSRNKATMSLAHLRTMLRGSSSGRSSEDASPQSIPSSPSFSDFAAGGECSDRCVRKSTPDVLDLFVAPWHECHTPAWIIKLK